jgi:hypothetical protein
MIMICSTLLIVLKGSWLTNVILDTVPNRHCNHFLFHDHHLKILCFQRFFQAGFCQTPMLGSH